MLIRILTRDPVSDDPRDGYEWRARHLTFRGWRLIRGLLRYYESLSYSRPDSLRAERVNSKDATCQEKPNS